jgi:hypothetical protein
MRNHLLLVQVLGKLDGQIGPEAFEPQKQIK